MTIDELKTIIVESLTVELESDPDFSSEILTEKVENAINEVKLARRYKQAKYSESMIERDIEKYLSIIRDVSLYDYNQSGIDFQSSHQENGTTRTFMTRRYLFNGVIPLANSV